MDFNQILQSITLGVVQGLTEFIPVSSSGHVDLLPSLFNWEQPSTIFLLFVHLGTLLALLIYFRVKIYNYLRVTLKWIQGKGTLKRKDDKENFRVLLLLILATIPAGLIALLIEKLIESFYTNPDIASISRFSIILTMGSLGIIFLFNEKLFTGKKGKLSKLTPLKSLFIGASQVLALMRGTSRSGITLITGQSMGLTKAAAAEFSFLLSIPLLTASSLLGIYRLLKLSDELRQLELQASVIGMIAAAISGYIAVRFMLNYLKRNNLKVFGVYRILFACIAFALLFLV